MISNTTSNRAALTLVELLVVICIIGMLSAVAMVRLTSLTHGANLEWAINRISSQDNGLRNHALKHARPTKLEFHLGTSHLSSSFGRMGDSSTSIDLGRNVKIKRLIAVSRETVAGNVSITYTPQGTSESFAVHITTSRDADAWLFVAGQTGQITRLEDGRNAESIIRSIRQEGANAR